MAFENLGKCISRIATPDLSGSQYRFVKLDGSAQLALPSSGGDAIGVLQDDPVAGGVGNVMVGNGITKVVAGAAIAAGRPIATDNLGRAIDGVTGDYMLGFALAAATAAGDVIPILFQRAGNVR